MGISTGTAMAISGAASLGGALISSGSASDAAGAQTAALEAGQATQAKSLQDQLAMQQKALEQQQAQYTENVAMEQPYMNAGAGALQEYDAMLGINPVAAAGTPVTTTTNGTTTTTPSLTTGTAPITGPTNANMQGALQALENTPGYQFELQQGENAITNGMSATTGNLSSAENKAMMNYAEGLAGTTYNSFMDRLNGVNTEGQQAASQTVAAGQANANAQGQIVQGETNAYANTGNNVTQLQANVGAAQASGYLGTGTAATSAANNVGSNLLLGSLVNSGSAGPYGGGSGNYGNLGTINWYK